MSNAAAKSSIAADRATLTYELDVRKQAIGSHLGGKHGVVVECPRCDKPACYIGLRSPRGAPIKQYAHGVAVFSTPIDQRSEWTDVCEVPQ